MKALRGVDPSGWGGEEWEHPGAPRQSARCWDFQSEELDSSPLSLSDAKATGAPAQIEGAEPPEQPVLGSSCGPQ